MALIDFLGIFNTSNPSNIQMDVSVTNNNNGTEYQSAELNVARNLAIELYALPENQATYASVGELVNDWGLSILGEVQNGWSGAVNTDGSFSITTAPFGVDIWNNTNTDPSQDMQFYTINIPKTQLEFDGVAGYNPATDKQIALSTDTISDGFVPQEGVNTFPVSSQYYTVIPEPGTGVFMLVAALAFLGVSRWEKVLGFFAKR